MLKIEPESSTKRGRRTDYKNSFIMNCFVSIVDTPASFISNHIKYIDFPRSTKYILFNKCNVKRKELTECVHGIKWSLVKKRINIYPNINYNMIIKAQDWVL